MIAVLTLALMAGAVKPAPAPRVSTVDDPPVKVSLNSDATFVTGDRARVHARVAEDGYVVVLRADADGRVRVLFPLDPNDDDFLRGGHDVEIRGRGGRDAFTVDERDGTGIVLAAWSPSAFRFDSYVRGDHWDYRVLDTVSDSGDAEAALLDIVREMAGEDHFEYDVVTYTVGNVTAYDDRSYSGPAGYVGVGWPYHSGLSVSIGFGYPYYYSSWGCDPWYGPYWCSSYPYFRTHTWGYRPYYRPYFYSGYGWGYRYGYGHGYGYHYPGYRPFGYVGYGNHYRGYNQYGWNARGGLIDRARIRGWSGGYTPVRVRTPAAGSFSSRSRVVSGGWNRSAPTVRSAPAPRRDGGWTRSAPATRSAPQARSAPRGSSGGRDYGGSVRRGGDYGGGSVRSSPRGGGGGGWSRPSGGEGGRRGGGGGGGGGERSGGGGGGARRR